MIILDTNIISELAKKDADKKVLDWFFTLDSQPIVTTTISLAELYYGIYILPEGKRKSELEKAVDFVMEDVLGDSLLSFDFQAGHTYAALVAKLRREGISMNQSDAMIAAIVKVHDGILITRNVKDFQHCSISILNPFD